MRRFSQRNSLVTLSDINITPLLDLAFVLLIIFVITTPMLTQSMNIKLPQGGTAEKKARNPKDVHTVEISSAGIYALDKKTMPVDAVIAELVRIKRFNPNLVVDIRADENGPFKHFAGLVDRCKKNNLDLVHIRTEVPRRR